MDERETGRSPAIKISRAKIKLWATILGGLGTAAGAGFTAWSKYAETKVKLAETHHGLDRTYETLNVRIVALEARVDVLLTVLREKEVVEKPSTPTPRTPTSRVPPVRRAPARRGGERPALPPHTLPAPAPVSQPSSVDQLIQRAAERRAKSSPRKLDDLLHSAQKVEAF